MDKSRIEEVILNLFDGVTILEFCRGVSGTVVVIVENGTGKHVFKVGVSANLRNTIQSERERREILVPFFEGHLPDVISYHQEDGLEIMQLEHVGDHNLHEVVMGGLLPNNVIETIFAEILQTKENLWIQTAEPFCQSDCLRDYPKRVEELVFRVMNLELNGIKVADVLDLQVQINGILYPNFRQLIEAIRHYRPSKFSCCSHGDLNGDNIILSGAHRWSLIDWEWTGRHDWIESVSRICGWWQVMATTLIDSPQVCIKDDKMELSYQLEISSLARNLVEQGNALGHRVAQKLDEDDFDKKFAYFLATYHLRDLIFQTPRGREDYAIPVIGGAFQMLFSAP